jgi:hypothetical protein
MAAPGTRATVIKGVVYPSRAQVNQVVAQLKSQLAASPQQAEQFKKDPRSVLAAFGLNEDVQRELLQDMGTTAAASICVFTDCYHTCWFTKCYVTHIVIVKD